MADEDVINRLKDLMGNIIEVYNDLNMSWDVFSEKQGWSLFNQKSTDVTDMRNNADKLLQLSGYVNLLNNLNIQQRIESIKTELTVSARVKDRNSIGEKISDYCDYRPERGKVPVKKCFNDLMGARVILECDSITSDELNPILTAYPIIQKPEIRNIKPNQSGYGYKAIHIYIAKDNYHYRWEIQIWLTTDEFGNYASHKYHRYKYTLYETGMKKK